MRKDYYAILGVERDAGQETIKRAFRRLARETHPDANPGEPTAEIRFREVAEAYEVLSDPARRHAYDRGATFDLSDLFGNLGSFDDLLQAVFGDSGPFGPGTTRSAPRRGRDVLVPVEVTLFEAGFGTTSEVRFRARVACSDCGGEGAAPGSSSTRCTACRGTGTMRVARRSLLGTMMTIVDCDTCLGTGRVVTERCPRCGGAGAVEGERTVRVEVPAGVTDGTRLRLGGRGESAGRLGGAGDLYVEVRVAPDARFLRDGDHLVHRLTVGIAQAALGTTLEVPLLEGGSEVIDLEPGTQPGTTIRLPGLGMSRLGRRGRGDLLVNVGVAVPDDLTLAQEEALRAYAGLRGEEAAQPKVGRRRRRR
ncbi:MAG: DnaJ C-terminal domain-containing protein [Acidimicrobiia bacterium]